MLEGTGNLLSPDKVATTEYFQFKHYLGEWGEKGAALSFSKNINQNNSLMYLIQYIKSVGLGQYFKQIFNT